MNNKQKYSIFSIISKKYLKFRFKNKTEYNYLFFGIVDSSLLGPIGSGMICTKKATATIIRSNDNDVFYFVLGIFSKLNSVPNYRNLLYVLLRFYEYIYDELLRHK